MSRWMVLMMGLLLFASCKKEVLVFGSGDGKFAVEDFDFDYLTSRAKFKYSNGKQKISATANFRIKKDSIIWVSISPGLGVELARVMISKEGIQAIDKLKRDYYQYNYEKLSKIYGFNVTYELIESTAIGNLLYRPRKKREISKSENYFSFTKIEGVYGVSQYIGTGSKKLEKLHAFDTTTNSSILVNYGDFQRIAGQVAPQSIQATINFAEKEEKDAASIEIEYNRTTVREDPLRFPFHVSSKYTRK